MAIWVAALKPVLFWGLGNKVAPQISTPQVKDDAALRQPLAARAKARSHEPNPRIGPCPVHDPFPDPILQGSRKESPGKLATSNNM